MTCEELLSDRLKLYFDFLLLFSEIVDCISSKLFPHARELPEFPTEKLKIVLYLHDFVSCDSRLEVGLRFILEGDVAGFLETLHGLLEVREFKHFNALRLPFFCGILH